MNIDPGVVTLVQGVFLEHISASFNVVSHYAFNLLYFFAVIEVVVIGLLWALQRDLGIGKILLKIIKIGLIFFVIRNYQWLLGTILDSFAKLSGVVVNSEEVTQYIFNPGKIWQYGYDVGVNLLQLATTGNLLGLTMVQIFLGFGILLAFGLLGIWLVVQIVGFYFVSFGALILMPLGAFNPSKHMFDRAVRGVLQAGMRLMAVMIVIGIAVVTWNNFDFTPMTSGAEFNINQPLGLLFTAILFLSLAYYLPSILSQIVGDIGGGSDSSVSVTTNVATQEAVFAPASFGSGDVRSATTVASMAGAGSVESAGPASVSISGNQGGFASSSTLEGGSRDSMSQANKISKSISDKTVKKIKADLLKALDDKRSGG